MNTKLLNYQNIHCIFCSLLAIILKWKPLKKDPDTLVVIDYKIWPKKYIDMQMKENSFIPDNGCMDFLKTQLLSFWRCHFISIIQSNLELKEMHI